MNLGFERTAFIGRRSLEDHLGQGSAVSILFSVKCPYIVELGPDFWKFVLVAKHLDVSKCCSQTSPYLCVVVLSQMCNHKRSLLTIWDAWTRRTAAHLSTQSQAGPDELGKVSVCSWRLAVSLYDRALTAYLKAAMSCMMNFPNPSGNIHPRMMLVSMQ